MARGDGIHRTSARNMRLTTSKLKNAQQHNEREKESYVNQDIVPERSHLNVHFKKPNGGYLEQFQKMEAIGTISTRGIKEDAFRYNTSLKNRLNEYAGKYPSECRLVDDDENGCLTFEIRKGRFSFKLNAPYSAERRKAASELAKKNIQNLQQGEK